MPGTTTPDGAPYPLASEPIADGAAAIQELAQWADDMYVQDLRVNRPAFGRRSRTFRATDTESVWLDTGTAWVPLGVMPGSVVWTGRSSEPAGYVFATGQAVARTGIYADLFAEWGTTFGAGNGSTTFNLPDIRGRAIIAPDGTAGRLTSNDALGQAGGSETVTLTTTQMPSHTHSAGTLATVGVGDHAHNLGTSVMEIGPAIGAGPIAGGATVGSGGSISSTLPGGAHGPLDITGATGSAGSGGAHPNTQPYIVLNAIIKL